ncbi:MAG: hypothetical protein GFH27_549287n89 [Chloroflexi bacterium AL-W]|nr:hypothetical protein [Chloroflexi bacterium AL-N1]NOK66363.1 hypothetical protein [Chloroflexi bacterium AL-N10]NOK71751.1 hypothetical protein [Chloroflexi bacterium AL-N5]NOK81008.1 hypothetical protein [Chloroflexi bacterium AL-W]NOK89281.1 hypothetical protein [Chloroflexi bacterium AL-N15]
MTEQQVSVEEVVRNCQHEQRRRPTNSESPWCVELFRRAFAGDEEAWSGIRMLYEPLMRSWTGVQSVVDAEEVLQEALLSFSRFAPQQPSLLADNNPGRVLAYLRTCVKTAIISLSRREQRQTIAGYLDEINEPAISYNLSDTVQLSIVLNERIEELLTDEEEKLIFYLRFIYGIKPQNILTHYPNRFSDIKYVYTLIQRVVRRLRDDPALQKLQM